MTAWRRFVATSVRRRSQRSIRLPAMGPSTTETASSIRKSAAVSVPDDVSVNTYTGSATRRSQSPVSLTSPPAQTSRKSRPDHGEAPGGAVVGVTTATSRDQPRSIRRNACNVTCTASEPFGTSTRVAAMNGRMSASIASVSSRELVGGHREPVRRETGGILPRRVERVGLVHIALGEARRLVDAEHAECSSRRAVGRSISTRWSAEREAGRRRPPDPLTAVG